MSARRQADFDPVQVECVVSYTGATVAVTVTPQFGSERISSPHNQLSESSGGSIGSGNGDLKELLRQSQSQSSSRGGGSGGRAASGTVAGTLTPVAAPQLTIRDLTAAVCRQLFGFTSSNTTTINIVAGASNNSLKDDVPLEPLLGQELFLFFDPRLLPKVQAELPATDHQLGPLIRRQRDAVKMMNTPLRSYFDRLQQETDFLMAEHRSMEDQLHGLTRKLPSYMDPLKEIRLLEDPSKSLADMVNHGEKRLKQSCEWLEKTTLSLPARGKSVDAAKESLDSILSSQSTLLTTTLRVGVEEMQEISRELQKLNLEKHQAAKQYMRTVSEYRDAVEKDRQRIKLIKQGLINWLNVDMLKDLPKAYEAALSLAHQRLVFYTAVKRVNTTLSYEASQLQLEVDAFVKEWGTRFPQNVLPELTVPVTAGKLPRDNLAVMLEQSVLEADEDPASDLLARLGLAGTGQPQSARRIASPKGQGSELKDRVSAQISALSDQLDQAMAEKLTLEDKLTRTEKQVMQMGTEMSNVVMEYATKQEGFESIIQALRSELEDQRRHQAGPPAAGSPSERTNVHLPSVPSNATLMSDSGVFDDADRAVVSLGVFGRSFNFMRIDKTFIGNATYGTGHGPNSVGVTLVIANFVVSKLGFTNKGGSSYVEEGDSVKCDVVEVCEDTPAKMGRCRIVKVIVTPSATKPDASPSSGRKKPKEPLLPDSPKAK